MLSLGGAGSWVGAGSGAKGWSPADSMRWRNSVNTCGMFSAAKGRVSGSIRLDCHSVLTVRPTLSRAFTWASSSGAAMSSQNTVSAPTWRAQAGSTSATGPCSKTRRWPKALNEVCRSCSVSATKRLRCTPMRRKPQAVGASCTGSCTYTSSRAWPWAWACSTALWSARWSSKRKSFRNQKRVVRMVLKIKAQLLAGWGVGI